MKKKTIILTLKRVVFVGALVCLLAGCRQGESPLVGTWLFYGIETPEGLEEWYKGDAHAYRILSTDSSLIGVITFENTSDTRTLLVGEWLPDKGLFYNEAHGIEARRFREHIIFHNADDRGLEFPDVMDFSQGSYLNHYYQLSGNGDTLRICDYVETEVWVRVPDGTVQRSEPDLQRTSLFMAMSGVRLQDIPCIERQRPETAALYALKELLCTPLPVAKFVAVQRTGDKVLVTIELLAEKVWITMRQQKGRWVIDHFYPKDVSANYLLQKLIDEETM